MKHFLGADATKLLDPQHRKTIPVAYDTDKLVNGHALVCGMSGTGKSFQCMKLLRGAADQGLEIDVFDVHGELSGICFENGGHVPMKGRATAKYSQHEAIGYNPLVLDVDKHTGGVTRQINKLLMLINGVAPLGIKQEACFRSLVTDTYLEHGISQDEPRSWVKREIGAEEWKRRQARGDTASKADCYPTLDDLKDFANRKMTALAIGGDDMAASAFLDLSSKVKALNRISTKVGKATSREEADKAEVALEAAKMKYVEAAQAWASALSSGRELEDVIRYSSLEVLQGLMNRIEGLNAAGIFNANMPPFRDAKVRVHDITALGDAEQILFVRLRLREIFDRRKREGATRSGVELRHVCFIDEGHKFFGGGAGEADIVSVIAREARKFGIGLWAASQSPTDFPKAFLTNVGFMMLLGIAPGYWGQSRTLLRIDDELLKRIEPKKVIAVKLQGERSEEEERRREKDIEDNKVVSADGEAKFQVLVVPNPDWGMGLRVVQGEKDWRAADARARAVGANNPWTAGRAPSSGRAAHA